MRELDLGITLNQAIASIEREFAAFVDLLRSLYEKYPDAFPLLLSLCSIILIGFVILLRRHRLAKEEIGFVTAVDDSDVTASLDKGLQKSRRAFLGKLKQVFAGSSKLTPEQAADIEELLIGADFGVSASRLFVQKLATELVGKDGLSEHELIDSLKRIVVRELEAGDTSREIDPTPVENGGPRVVMVVGVNGVGKTTTVAKLGSALVAKGARVMFAACDTFRAAAGEQLDEWAKRIGVLSVSGKPGSKPATVAYEAIEQSKVSGVDVLLVDTAGRLHNKINLMNELEGVKKIIDREHPGAPHEILLVLDGTTGQNGLQQALQFNKQVGLTGLIVTKLDGTSRGGIVVAIKRELGVPIRYVGVGEGVDDLRPFCAHDFAHALFNDDRNTPILASSKVSERKARRTRIR